jgi:hypothetical protein
VGKKLAYSNEENQKLEGDQNQTLPEYIFHRCFRLMGKGCVMNVYVQYTVCVGVWCVLRSCYSLSLRSENNHKPQWIWTEETVTNLGNLVLYGGEIKK